MKLYSYYRSSAAYRVRIALNLKGITYDQQAVHLVRNGGEQNSELYRTLNPQGLVPTLIDGKVTLSQSIAIIEYLEETHPDPSIMPKKPDQRAFARQIAQIIASDIHPLNNLRVLTYLTNELGQSQQDKNKWYEYWVAEGFKALEEIISESPYHLGKFCCGNTPSLADICLVPQLYNARRYNCPLENYPTLQAIEHECLKLDAFKDASPENQPDTPEDQRPDFIKNMKSNG